MTTGRSGTGPGHPTRRQLVEDLASIRSELDRVDSTLLASLHERLALVRRVGQIKQRLARGSWAPAREKAVLERILKENRGRFPERALRTIFQVIFSISRQHQRPIKVVYYGSPGSPTQAAAAEQFGLFTDYESANSLEDVFDLVGSGQADYGVVPLEVSCEGVVSHSLEVFLRSDLKICAEYYLNLELVLAGRRGNETIERVFVQPQVYGLAREWIGLFVGRDVRVQIVPGSLEAGQACKAEPGSACVVQPFTARELKLAVLCDRIPYGPTRRLRFLTAGTALPPATSSDKTTIAFSLIDRVGVLEEALRSFRRHRVNLAFLESYPASKASPTMTFFADILGHVEAPAIQQAVEALKQTSAYVKVLGSYPVFQES